MALAPSTSEELTRALYLWPKATTPPAGRDPKQELDFQSYLLLNGEEGGNH